MCLGSLNNWIKEACVKVPNVYGEGVQRRRFSVGIKVPRGVQG